MIGIEFAGQNLISSSNDANKMSTKSASNIPFSLFLGFILFRVLNVSVTQTFFQPDEYWQSLEPAHELAYGYGYLTWEWREGLRSAAHPMFFSIFYRIASDGFGIVSPDALVWVPCLVQAFIAAVGDYYFCKLALKIFQPSQKVLWFAAVITTGSAFNFYCSTRTFSNSLEMVLTTIALAYWPWSSSSIIDWKTYTVALMVASISCVFRPTNALIWLFLGLVLILRSPFRVRVAGLALVVVSTTFALNFGLDYLYFGRPVVPVVKFLQFNLFQSLSHFYGTSPWHYYISQGVPILLIGFLPFTLADFVRSKLSTQISSLIITIILIYSCLRHKEFRFIYPILPLLHVKTLNAFLNPMPLISRFTTKKVLAFCCILNLSVALFFNTVHQRGVIDVMKYLRNDTTVKSVGFLMPCHSTPWQSHLHKPLLEQDKSLWFLTCEPPINMNKTEREAYLDVADQFYENPVAFLDTHFPSLTQETSGKYSYTWPSHLIFFEALEDTMMEYLQESNYSEV